MGGGGKKVRETVGKVLNLNTAPMRILDPASYVTHMITKNVYGHHERFVETGSINIKNEVAYTTQNWAEGLRQEWETITQPALDALGISTSSKIYTVAEDMMYKDAYQTASIVAAVILAVVSWYVGGLAAGWVGESLGVTMATGAGGITLSGALVEAVVAVGVSALLSPAYEGVIMTLILQGDMVGTMQMINKVLEIEEMGRLNNFMNVMDSTIYEKMAGGHLYNDVWSGGSLYSYDQDPGLDASVGGLFEVSQGTRMVNFIGEDKAGSGIFEKQFDLNLIDTNVNAEGSILNVDQIKAQKVISSFNRTSSKYNTEVEDRNEIVKEYQQIVDDYNSLSSGQKNQANYDATMKKLKALESKITGYDSRIAELQSKLDSLLGVEK